MPYPIEHKQRLLLFCGTYLNFIYNVGYEVAGILFLFKFVSFEMLAYILLVALISSLAIFFEF